MVTINIRLSARNMCTPLTVNRLLKAVRKDFGDIERFWPRLIKDKSDNYGKIVGVKLDQENLDFLRSLKKLIKNKYGLFVSYSMLVCTLMKMYRNPGERVIMSMNVKGYRALSSDLAERLKGISSEILKVLPDLILIQEFKAGEHDNVLKSVMHDLGRYYVPIFPAGYRKNDDYNNCVCIILAGKNMKINRYVRLKDESAGFKLRYNLIEADDLNILNAWIPQIFNAQQDRMDIAEKMWKNIIDTAKYYSDKTKKFCLIGDLNAYIGGSFEDKILRLNTLLRDTKTVDSMTRPTGLQNILDHVFVNRFFDQTEMIRTSIYDPSIKGMDLSDHDALITSIKEVF